MNRSLASVTCGVVLAMATMELAIRHFLYDVSFVSEPEVGDVIAAGKTVRWGREGHAVSHWTTHGVRATAPPDPAKPTVLVLGDSYTEALMIDDDNVYAARAQKVLRASGDDAQIVNAGRATCSLADYVSLAAHFRSVFKPSWTVIELREEDLGDEAWMVDRTHFGRVDGKLTTVRVAPPRRGGVKGVWWTLRQKSMLVGYIAVRTGELRRAVGEEPPLFRAGSVRAPVAAAPPTDYPVEEELEFALDAFDGRVTFLYIADYDPNAPERRSSLEQRLLDFCDAHHTSCVDTRARYGDLPPRGVAPFGFPNTAFNFGHMNTLGHQIAGDLLGAELSQVRAHAVL